MADDNQKEEGMAVWRYEKNNEEKNANGLMSVEHFHSKTSIGSRSSP